MAIFKLDDHIVFPHPEWAEPNGLLAIGGDLSPERLIMAYSMGIFPWYEEDSPILWWSPDPRLVLFPGEIHISRSLRRVLRKGVFHVSFDTSFRQVVEDCRQIRREAGERTWILPEMVNAYCRLHEMGIAHSVETWLEGHLVGGLYGISLGCAFSGESMFARKTDASKVALVALVVRLHQWGFHLIDCQVSTEHLKRFGAREIPRRRFLQHLASALQNRPQKGSWHPERPFPSSAIPLNLLECNAQ